MLARAGTVQVTPPVPAPRRPRLVAVYCRRCRRFITDAIPGADVRCPGCDHWVRAATPEQRTIDFEPKRRRGRPL